MNIWILVSLIGFIAVIFGFAVYVKDNSPWKNIPKSSIFMGIFFPIVAAFFYSETVIELIPQITLIDLSAFFVTGMISGFFISIFLIQKSTSVPDN